MSVEMVGEESVQVPAHLLAALVAAVSAHGPDAVVVAIDNAHLFTGIRALSRLSLKTGGACVDEGFCATVVFKLNPSSKLIGERVEIRTITGSEIGMIGSG